MAAFLPDLTSAVLVFAFSDAPCLVLKQVYKPTDNVIANGTAALAIC